MLRFLIIFGLLANLAAAQTAGPATANDTTRLEFPNADVKDVLAFYEKLTGKQLVLDNAVQGPLNIVASGNIPKSEAIRIIEASLLLNGFTLVPVEDSRIVRVVGTGKNPRGSSVPLVTDELLIPAGDQVVTFYAKLSYADADELQKALNAVTPPAPGGYTNITALPKAQAIMITENAATIRTLLRVIREADQPPAEVISEFIPLERADAGEVLEKLNTIFEKKDKENGGVSRSTPPPPTGAAPAPNTVPADPATGAVRNGSLSEDSIIIGKIKVSADIRTNRIHVITRPVNLPFVRQLVHELDSNVSFGEPVSRTLRNVSVADVLDVIVTAITEPGMKADTSGQAAPSTAKNSRASTSGGLGQGGSSLSSGGSGDSSTGSSFDVTEGLATEPVDTTPEARTVGTTRLIADKNANAIIVIGNADAKAKVFRLLDYLDRRIPQVMLQTIIGELNLGEKEQFGVDYILRNRGLGLSPIVLNSNSPAPVTSDGTGTGAAAAGGNTTTGSTNPGRSASDLVSFGNNGPALNLTNLLNQNTVRAVAAAGGTGLNGFITAGNSMTAVITALEDSNRFRVVSRPSVFTRNNKKAIIASGQEIAVPVNIQSAVGSGVASNGLVTSSSVQFKRVALQLEVVPLINSDREVALDILQKVDEVSGSTRIDNNDIPTVATRYVRTSVTVPNEGTLVLGGLIKQSFNNIKSGIPVLSKIPLLGYLFSNTSKEKIRTELVILIRPQVSWAPPDSDSIRARAEEFYNMDPHLESSLYPRGAQLEGQPVPVASPVRVKPAKTSKAQAPAAAAADPVARR